MGWWVDEFMGSWVDEFMGSWVHGFMGSWVHRETMPKWRDPGLAQKVHRMHPNDSFPRQFWRAFKTIKSCIQWSKILYYLRLAHPRNQINNAIQGDHCVLETAVGNHCVMIPWSKILYYLRLAQPRNQINNAIQGDNCVLETAVRNSLCYDTMIQNIILPQISSAQKSN